MSMLAKERGATTIEILAGVAILAIITPVLGSLIHGALTTPKQTVLALQATSGTGATFQWLSRDITQAQSSNLVNGAAGVSSATFTWTDYYGGGQTSHSLAYSLDGTNLQRTLNGVTSTVGRKITDVTFARAGETITVSVTASPATGVTDQKTIRLYLRANA